MDNCSGFLNRVALKNKEAGAMYYQVGRYYYLGRQRCLLTWKDALLTSFVAEDGTETVVPTYNLGTFLPGVASEELQITLEDEVVA